MTESTFLSILLGYGIFVLFSVLFLKKTASFLEIIGLFVIVFFLNTVILGFLICLSSLINFIISNYNFAVSNVSEYGVILFNLVFFVLIPSFLILYFFILIKRKSMHNGHIPFMKINSLIVFFAANISSLVWVFFVFFYSSS